MHDFRMLSLSILYRVLRCLVGLIAVLARRDVSKDAELLVLRHENTLLRRKLPRVRYTPADRMWLAALSRLLPRRRRDQLFPVTPATVLAWHHGSPRQVATELPLAIVAPDAMKTSHAVGP